MLVIEKLVLFKNENIYYIVFKNLMGVCNFMINIFSYKVDYFIFVRKCILYLNY